MYRKCSICGEVFQFTTSQGGRLERANNNGDCIIFQFTTSQGGRHCHGNPGCIRYCLSIHDLTRRSTRSVMLTQYLDFLSIHDLTRRSTPSWIIFWSSFIFQFTTSQGGRPLQYCQLCHSGILSIHDLTRRSTPAVFRAFSAIRPFNSRPHKEVDKLLAAYMAFKTLSIHDLTRRSTWPHTGQRIIPELSIHDLTRRSTLCP